MSQITLEIRSKTSSEILFENSYGIGLYLLLFHKYHYQFSKKIYFFENTVEESLHNIEKLLNYIKNERQVDEFYDDWSLRTIEKVILLFEDMKEKLETYPKDFIVISDYVSNIINYSIESSVIHPKDLIKENKYWIMNLIEGNFNGKYLDYKEELKIKKMIEDFAFTIKDKIQINPLSIFKKRSILPIGNERLLRFSFEFYVKNKNEALEQVLYPILEIIKFYELGYEQINFQKSSDDILEIMFFKLL